MSLPYLFASDLSHSHAPFSDHGLSASPTSDIDTSAADIPTPDSDLLEPDLSIVLPSFNEADNLPLILDRIRPFWPSVSFELIIVNNGSTDHTASVLASFLDRRDMYPFLRVVSIETNQGYGHGIMTGLKAATGKYIAYSHADIQTPPEDIFKAFELMQTLRKTHTFPILVKGHRINRSSDATFFTKGLSWVVQVILGCSLPDINGQPKLFPKSFLSQLDLSPDGFSFDTYVLYRAHLAQMPIYSFNVAFDARLYGESKATPSFSKRIKTITAYLISVVNMALAHLKEEGNLLVEMSRFFLVGTFCTIVTYATFYIGLNTFYVPYMYSSSIGYIAGAVAGYILNRFWTFKSKQVMFSLSEFIKYSVVNLTSFLVNLLGIIVFTEYVGLIPEWSQVVTLAMTAAVNFVGFKFWAFKSKLTPPNPPLDKLNKLNHVPRL